MSGMRRFATFVAATGLGALLALPAAASADTYSTRVVITPGSPTFHGWVDSRGPGCLGDRTIKLVRKKDGREKLLGTATTDAAGNWEIKIAKQRLTPGNYFAKATARDACLAGRSTKVSI